LWVKSESVITVNDLFSKSFLIFNSFQWCCWSFATFLGSDAKMRYYLEVQTNRIERENVDVSFLTNTLSVFDNLIVSGFWLLFHQHLHSNQEILPGLQHWEKETTTSNSSSVGHSISFSNVWSRIVNVRRRTNLRSKLVNSKSRESFVIVS
jgi:hypothetical protein